MYTLQKNSKVSLNKKINSISVFFPAHNEEANIAESISQAKRVLIQLGIDYEIIVVNDGSRDRTREIVEEICEKGSRVRIINHKKNLGYGAAVWSGITSCTKEYIFFTDGDLQFDLNEIDRLLAYVPEYDAVIGYRIKRRDRFIRLINAWGWNRLNRVLFGLKVKDIDCAFKLFKRDIFDDIFVKSRGAMISAEMLVRVYRGGYKVIEVGVNHYPRTQGSATGAKPSVIIRAFRELLEVYKGDLGNKTVKQITKFFLVGLLNTAVDLITFFVLISTIAREYLVLSKSVSYFVGIINSYAFNKLWTFRSSGKVIVEFPKFVFSNLASLLLNSFIMLICVRNLHTSVIFGLICATLGAFLFNFLVSKKGVFNK